MSTAFQILAFYLILGFVTNGLIGYYPKIDPNHAPMIAAHMKLGKICSHSMMTLQMIALIYLIIRRFQIGSFVRKHRLDLPKGLQARVLYACVGTPLVIFGSLKIYLGGKSFETGEIALTEASKAAHFHSNILYLLLIIAGLFLSAAALVRIEEAWKEVRRKAGFAVSPDKFLDDSHSRNMWWAFRFLFLGINVWWPYLVLKYAAGLSSLKGLWFLPIHLAGVIPYAVLKRKHKFKRTINPEYPGKIKAREKYQAPA